MDKDPTFQPGFEPARGGPWVGPNVNGPAGPDDFRGALNYDLTDEERQAIRECNKESFFQRCIPIGALMGFGTYYGIKAEYFKPSPKWGAFPKVALAVTVGYFIGKFSYQSKCAEKLMALPNSKLGEILRQRKGGGFRDTIDPGYGTAMSLAPFSGMSSKDTYSDLEPRTSDIDTYRPLESYDDNHLPFEGLKDVPDKPESFTSYEELRRKNREAFEKNRGVNYRGNIDPQSPEKSSDSLYSSTWDK